MCLHACPRDPEFISSLCDECIHEAYELDMLVERNETEINATPATEREYREFMEDTTLSADEWYEEQKREAANAGYSV